MDLLPIVDHGCDRAEDAEGQGPGNGVVGVDHLRGEDDQSSAESQSLKPGLQEELKMS